MTSKDEVRGEAERQGKRGRRGLTGRLVRVVLVVAIFLVIIAGVIVAFGPRLAGTSTGLALINRLINTNPQMKIEIRDIDLRWSGVQRIPEIHINQNNGAVTADLSVELTGSLWAWGVSGSRDFGTVQVGGQVVIDEAKLNAASSSSSTVVSAISGSSNDAAGSLVLPLNLTGEVKFKDVGISYLPDASAASAGKVTALGSGPVEVKNLTGTVDLVADQQGGKVNWQFSADTTVSGSPGSINSTGKITGFTNGITGVVDAKNAKCEMVLESTAVPIAIVDALTDGAGRLTALLGGKADIKTKMAGSLDAGGTAEISINSPAAEVRLAATINRNAIIVNKGGTAQFTFAKGALSSFANDETVRKQLASSDGKINIGINELRIPFRNDLSIKYDGISVNADMNATLNSLNLPDKSLDSLTLSKFTTTIKSDNITDDIAVAFSGETILSNTRTGRDSTVPFAGNLSLRKAVSPTGSFNLSNKTVRAEFTAENINSALIDETAGLDHWVQDAAGRMIDRVYFTMGSGETGDTPVEITVEADSEQTQLRFKARLDDENGVAILANENDEPQVVITVDDNFRKRIAALLSSASKGDGGAAGLDIQSPGRITLAIRKFNLPATGLMTNYSDIDAVKKAMRSLSVDVTISMRGGRATFPASYLTLDAGKTETDAITLDSTTAELSSSKLSDEVGIQIKTTGTLDSANNKPFTIRIPLQITSPLDATARRSSAEVLVNGLIGSTINAKFTMQEGKTGCNISANGEMDLTPALARRFLTDVNGVSLERDCSVKFAIKPIHLGRSASNGEIDWGALFSSSPVAVRAETQGITARWVGQLDHAVGLKNAVVTARWSAGARGIPGEVNAKGDIFDADTKRKICSVNIQSEPSGDGGRDEGGNILRVDLREVNTTGLEKLLGYQTGTLSDITGTMDGGGEVSIEADIDTLMDISKGKPNERALRLVGKFPRFTADISGRMNQRADRIVIDSGGVIRFAVKNTTAQRMLAGMYEMEGKAANHILVNDDIPVSLNIREASINADAFKGEGNLRLDDIALDSELALGAFQLQAAHGNDIFDQFTLRNARIALQSKDGEDVLGFDVSALIRDRAESPAIFRELVLGVNDSSGGDADSVNDASNLINALLGKEDDAQGNGSGNENETSPGVGNGSGGGAVTKLPAKINPDGEIRVTGSITGLYSASGESKSGNAWVIHNLSGKADHLPVPFLDVLADSSGTLTAAVGSSLSADIEAKEFGPGRGAVKLTLKSDSGRLNIRSAKYLADGTIQVGTNPGKATPQMTNGKDNASLPMFASLDLTPDMAHAILDKVSPMFYDIRKRNGPITLSASYLRLPTDGDLSKLDGDLVLDLGQIDMSSGGLFGDLLGTAKKKVGDSTTATLAPIPIRIRKGVLEYEGFDIQTDQFKVSTGGTINLVTKKLDLTAAVPLIGWQSTFGQLTGALKGPVTDWNIPFYLVIRGTIDDPKIKPDPKGAQRVAKELFQNTIDETVGNIFNQLLNNKKDKKKKKKNGGGG